MKKAYKILGICMSLLILASIVIVNSVTYTSSESEQMYFSIEELRYRNEPNMGYAIGNPDVDTTNAVKLWNIVRRSTENSSDILEGDYYCLKAGVGFDTNANVKYDVFFDMKLEKEQIKGQNSILESIVEGTVELEDGSTVGKYECILAVLDRLYLPGTSTQEYKDELLEEVIKYAKTQSQYNSYIELMELYPLTDDDMTAIQQAIIWYFTNYGEDGGKYDKTGNSDWINYKLEGTQYTALSDYKLYDTDEGMARSYQGEAFYNYMIKEAKANASKYASGEISSTSPISLVTQDLSYEETSTDYILGPIQMEEAENNTLSYTIECIVSNENVQINDYTILDSNKNAVATGVDLKDLMGQEFYISINKSNLNDGETNVNVKFNITYEVTELIVAVSTENASEQPIAITDKEELTAELELSTDIIPKEFDLALRKYITKVNDVELTGASSRVPNIDEGTLTTGTTATYKHKKDPVVVKTGDKVTYKLTIYNEGEKEGRATRIVDQLPTGLKFTKVVSGNFELDSYSEDDNKLNLVRIKTNTDNLAAYEAGNLSSETIEIECEVTQAAGTSDKILTNVAWISEEVDGMTNETITTEPGEDRDSEPGTAPEVNKDNMENYTGNNNKEDLTDSNNYYKGQQDDDDFEKLILNAVTSVTVNKTWDDSNNQDGMRVEEVVVALLKNGTETATQTLNAANNWTYTFENLPLEENGSEIEYTVVEKTQIGGYTSSVTENSVNNFTITNSHTPLTTRLTVYKQWEDNDNQDGIRPEKIEVVLIKNGQDTETSVILSESNDWQWIFEDLPLRENGNVIEYSVREKSEVEGYTTTVVESANARIIQSFSYTIINEHIPEVTKVTVNKVWNDSNNEDGMRATEVEVALLKNGTETTTQTLSAANNWTYTFENLPVKENGSEVEYTVVEKTQIDGYTSSVTENSENNFTVTNTHIVEREFDLALRKYITKINDVELTDTASRVPNIDEGTLTTGTTATYKHKKDPILVKTGDKVTYKLTIYNEGEKEGRATKIVDQLPTGLKFTKVVSGNFELDSYSEDDNRLNLKRVEGNTDNLPAYVAGNLSSETIEIECEVTQTAEATDKILTNVAWISEEVDGETNETITTEQGKDRDSEPGTVPEVSKDNMENYTGNNNKEDLTDSNNYYKGQQDDDDFEKLIIQKAEGIYNLQIIKVDNNDSNKKLSGAEFKVILPDGTEQNVTTNENGIIEILGINILEEGTDTITIEELKPPVDYEKIVGNITVQITKGISNGKYVVTNVGITEETGLVKTNFDNGTIKIIVPNKEVEKLVDFKLIKRIVAVNGQNVPERIENVDVSKLNTIDKNGNVITTGEYQLNKEPVGVKKGDIVTYTFRVYNEGMIDGYVQEITEDIPEGLEFIWSEKDEEESEVDTVLTKEEKEAIEFNKEYQWTNFVYNETNEKIIQISSGYLSKENETSEGENLIPAFGENDGTKTEEAISYKEISVKLKVIADDVSGTIIRNEAAITEDCDANGEPVDDRDSDTEDWKKYEDDEDYDNIILQSFDLALRKFIIAVSNDTNVEEKEYLRTTEGTYTREPVVDTSKLNTLDENEKLITTAIYNHTKEPVLVSKNDIVVYMLRVYNEGEIDGYASEIKDHLPSYLEFVEGEFNEEYGWEVSEDGRTVTTRYLENEVIIKAQTNADGEIELAYKEVPIMCKVRDTAKTNENITNIADITEYLDENKDSVTDRDSQENNVELPTDEDLPSYKDDEKGEYIPGQQDDDDFEKIIVKEFDLALRKWVTEAIVIEDGQQSITQTGHQPYDDPEQIVKVDLHRKKLNQVTVKFRYSIRIINEGDLEGYAKEITDYIPDGLKFVAEDNPGWTDEGNSVISTRLLENTLLKPGEYADVEVILTWENNENNMGVMVNTAEISEDYNEYGVPDKDSTPDNKKQGEDDIDDAPVMLSITTGQARVYFTLGFVILITIASGVILIKKYVL